MSMLRATYLFFHDSVVLLLLGRSFKTLPRKLASEEVHEDVTKRLKVVSPRLLDTKMGVDRGVSSSTRQVLVLTVGDVKVSLGVSVLLGKSEIDDVDLVASLADAHQAVVDITKQVRGGREKMKQLPLEIGS